MQNLSPLAGPRVAEAARRALSDMFGAWARALGAAFSRYAMPDGSLPARLGACMRLLERADLHARLACSAPLHRAIMPGGAGSVLLPCPAYSISIGALPYTILLPGCLQKTACTMSTVVPVHAAPATEPAMETAASLVEQFLPELAAPLIDRSADSPQM